MTQLPGMRGASCSLPPLATKGPPTVDITDLLRSPQIAQALQQLGQAYGLTPAQLQSILDAVLPAFANRIERNTLSRGGVADVVAEMSRPEHAQVLADPTHPAATEVGIGALDTVLGSKAASRNVAAQAAMSTGIEQAIIQKLLPILASLIMAALSKGATQGGLGDILRKLPDILGGNGAPEPQSQPRGRSTRRSRDDEDQDAQQDTDQDQPDSTSPQSAPMPTPHRGREAPQSSDGGLGDILNKIPGFPSSQTTAPAPTRGPGPASSTGNDGSYGGGFGGSPLPIPGDRIPGINALDPYGKLPDVIRQDGAPIGNSPVSAEIRSVLGSLLGFESKGFLSWVFRLLVLRWGWGLLQRIVLGRR